jgi:hypothetical protein
MAVDWMDSVAHYDVNTLPLKWTFSPSPSIVPTGGPRGNPCIQYLADVTIVRSHQSAWVWGWRYRAQVSQTSVNNFIYVGAHAGQALVAVRIEPDATVSVVQWDGGAWAIMKDGSGNICNTGNPALFTTPIKINPLVWYWIECAIALSNAGNCFVTGFGLRINTQLMFTASTNGDTGVPVTNLLLQTATVNSHTFGGSNGNFGSWGCDYIFIRNDGTGLYNSYPGDTAIEAIFPDSDQTIQWNATGSPQYKQINETPPDDDSSYIYMAPTGTPPTVVNQIDSFLFQPLAAFTGQIIAVHLLAFARKDDEGTREFTFVVDDQIWNAVPSDTAPTFYPSDTYTYFDFTWDHDPSQTSGGGGGTYVAWTVADFNATKFGVKLIA